MAIPIICSASKNKKNIKSHASFPLPYNPRKIQKGLTFSIKCYNLISEAALAA
jgi:hypothetical protein